MNNETDFANATTNTTRRGVFEEDPSQTLVLLVDFKTSGIDTFPLVHDQLEALRERDYLSFWDGKELHTRPVTVVSKLQCGERPQCLSIYSASECQKCSLTFVFHSQVGTGNTPFNLIVAETQRRDIFFDAPLDQLWETPSNVDGSSYLEQSQEARLLPNQKSSQGTMGTENATPDDFNSTTSYYASVSFMHSIGFVWRGRLSSKQLNIIRGQIQGAHRRGLKTRYWDT